jgi:hypothetical protein
MKSSYKVSVDVLIFKILFTQMIDCKHVLWLYNNDIDKYQV